MKTSPHWFSMNSYFDKANTWLSKIPAYGLHNSVNKRTFIHTLKDIYIEALLYIVVVYLFLRSESFFLIYVCIILYVLSKPYSQTFTTRLWLLTKKLMPISTLRVHSGNQLITFDVILHALSWSNLKENLFHLCNYNGEIFSQPKCFKSLTDW